MYKLLTTEQIRELERRARDEQGKTERDLMTEAGKALLEIITDDIRETTQGVPPRIAVLTGPGNNGGDGWTVALMLHQEGINVRVLAVRDPMDQPGIAGEMAYEATTKGVRWELLPEEVTPDSIAVALDGSTLVVDALLGIGIHLPLNDQMAAIGAALNRMPVRVISADVPTGVDADTGATDENAVMASRTVTFLAAKRGLVMLPASRFTGDVSIAPLGVDPSAQFDFPGAPELRTDPELAGHLPLPAFDANKYTRGTVLVIAGSRTFPGAAVLAARAAARCGAGYVSVAAPESVVPILQTHLVSVPVIGMPETRTGSLDLRALETLVKMAGDVDCVLLGPGLTNHPKTCDLVRAFVPRITTPLVLDADGINAFVDHRFELTTCPHDITLTPHAGELARLVEKPVDELLEDPVESARSVAGGDRTVVFKGPNTVIASAAHTSIDLFGPPVLATAGSGDVLAGIIAGLRAQGLSSYDAACLGTRLQGRAGDAAAGELTPVCVNANDLVNMLPEAVDILFHALHPDLEDRS